VTPTDSIVSQAQRFSDWWSPPGEGESGEADGARQRKIEAAVRCAGPITLYAVLRISHSILAFLLFLTFTAHMSAVLFHTLVLRDGLIDRMALWPTKSPAAADHKA
jgi:hypothetical protein